MKESYTKVSCDYNDGNGTWIVEAWTTNEPDEIPTVIAHIHEKTGQVNYSDSRANTSSLAQLTIKTKINEIQNNPIRLPSTVIPSTQQLYDTTLAFIKKHQGKKKFINTQDFSKDDIYCFAWNEDSFQYEEYIVHAIRAVYQEIELIYEKNCVGSCVITHTPEDLVSKDANWKKLRLSNILYVQSLFNIAEHIDQYVNKKIAEPGTTVSKGTHKLEDIIPAFMHELKTLWQNRYIDLIIEHPNLRKALKDQKKDDPWWHSQEALRILVCDIFTAISKCAPVGYHFTTHPDNDDVYGFWPNK